MAQQPDSTPPAWPAVLAVLALVGLAIGVHLTLKHQGMPVQTRAEQAPCSPAEELVCTDVEHIERMLRDED